MIDPPPCADENCFTSATSESNARRYAAVSGIGHNVSPTVTEASTSASRRVSSVA